MKCSQCPVKKGVRVCEDGDALCVACSAAKAHKSAQDPTTTEVSLSDLMVKLTTMGSDLAEVKSGHREIINSINFLSSKFDEINDKMDKLEQSNNELKKENTDLGFECQSLSQMFRILNNTVGDKIWKLLEFQKAKMRTLVPSH